MRLRTVPSSYLPSSRVYLRERSVFHSQKIGCRHARNTSSGSRLLMKLFSLGFAGFGGRTWFDEAAILPIARTATLASIPSMSFTNSEIRTSDVLMVAGLSFAGLERQPSVINRRKGIPPGGDISDSRSRSFAGHRRDVRPFQRAGAGGNRKHFGTVAFLISHAQQRFTNLFKTHATPIFVVAQPLICRSRYWFPRVTRSCGRRRVASSYLLHHVCYFAAHVIYGGRLRAAAASLVSPGLAWLSQIDSAL